MKCNTTIKLVCFTFTIDNEIKYIISIKHVKISFPFLQKMLDNIDMYAI